MISFDTLIIGGGAAGMSCALVLGSGLKKSFAADRKVGIIIHQRASHLQSALFNNVLGVAPGTTGKEILASGIQQLNEHYPEVVQMEKEKVVELCTLEDSFRIITNKNEYFAASVVVAVGYTSAFDIKGLEKYVIPHAKAKASKNRVQLKNQDHLVKPGLFVAGTLAGHRSQFSIATGSGAAVATDILTGWNNGQHTKVHDSLK